MNSKAAVAQLIEQAEKFMDQFEFEQAEAALNRALEMDPHNTKAMDLLAELLMGAGNVERAKDLLQKSIQIAPDADFEKYMNLGQILSGADAISCYKRGVEVMLVHKRTTTPAPTTTSTGFVIPPMIDQQLCHALCALSELYLTDSCYDDNAEKECEKFLEAALQHNPLSAETYYLMASMRVSQQRPADALTLLNKSYNLWKVKAEEMLRGKENHDHSTHDHSSHQHDEHGCCGDHHEEDDEAAFLIPSFVMRHNTAKLFVELEQYKEALPILAGLVMEQDAMPGVWYTYALAYHRLKDHINAFECLAMAKELIAKGEGMGMELSGEDDGVLVEKVTKLDTEVRQKLTEQGIEVDNENTMDDDEMGE